MSNDTPTPAPGDSFPAGSPSDMRDLLLGPDSQPPAASKPSGPWVPPTAEKLQAILPGGYEIVRMLGRGGMGAVYMGRQVSLDRPVAIKILSGALAEKEGDFHFKERFQNEARAMAKLSHPGIVAVYDFGETGDGLLYIVMEYIDGTDVQRMIVADGRLRTEYAMAITAYVCDALAYAHARGIIRVTNPRVEPRPTLAYAHARGIIHRDIKPANIMVGYDGVVKVADFGLAKVQAVEGQSLGLTMSGMVMGTMHFMAPECLEYGAVVDHRVDVYAVGVMLYMMLTGKVPHGIFELPSMQVAGMDPRYDGIIARAMREDREERYQSAMELRLDLDAILTQPVPKVDAESGQPMAALPTRARPQRPGGKTLVTREAGAAPPRPVPAKPRSSLAWVAGPVLLLTGVGVWWYLRRETPAPVAMVTDTSVVSRPSANPTSQTGPTSPTASDPAGATKDRPFENRLGMKFVPVPGTDALFCIHETRYRDYEAYAKENPGIDGAWRNQTYDGFPITERAGDHPVTRVSWEDAKAFCAWLSRKDGKTYRLPTDEEWSLAVGLGGKERRSPSDTPKSIPRVQDEFPWGTEWPPPAGAGNYSDQSRKEQAPRDKTRYIEGNYDDGFPTTAPVMSFAPNPFGLYDLGGNVWEWCEDLYSNEDKSLVFRGSCWYDGGRGHLFSTSRHHEPPEVRFITFGFRVVLAPSEPTPPPASITAAPTTPPPSSGGWLELFDGATLGGWNTGGQAQWKVENAAITSDEGGNGALYRQLASPWFELTGEARMSETGNGGIHFHLEDAAKLLQGYEFQFCGSLNQQRGVGPGGLFAYAEGRGAHINAPPGVFPDNEFTPFRLLVEPDRIQGWIGNRQTFDHRRRLDPSRPSLLAISRWGPDGAAAYRNLRLRMIEAGAPDVSAAATKEQPYENSLGMKFVPVPGTDVMFCIHETRYRDYEAYAKEYSGINGDWKDQTVLSYTITERAGEHPVWKVNWEDAQGFCAWLSKKEERTYRLPTDEEWSLAAGLGGKELRMPGDTPESLSEKIIQEFPWGTTWPPPAGAGNYSDRSRKAKAPGRGDGYLEEYDDGFPTTAPVMSFAPNRFGLYDMGGNVRELVEDWFNPAQNLRVHRGSSWHLSQESNLRSMARGTDNPMTRRASFGFRIVLAASGQAASPPIETTTTPPSTPTLLPELAQRLEAYLAARRGALDTLVGHYLRNLDTRLAQANSAADLTLATAFEEEKARVAALRTRLAQTPTDTAAAAKQWPALPALAEDAPAKLAELRQVWEAEHGKIRADLDGKLAQSLQALEAELTRARRREEARSVLAYRESLQGSAGTPARN